MTSNISRNNILNALSEAGVPLALAEILVALGASGEASGALALEHLGALIERGSVVRTRRNRYALSERMDMVSGRVTGHRDGYGFVERTGSAPDLYLAPREMRRVLHGDKVLARVKRIDNRGRHEGVVVSLVERGTRTLVGRFVQDRGVGYVVPDDSRFSQDVTVFPEDQGEALDGHIVVVEIVGHPFDSRHLKGRVIECLGDHLAPGMESEIAIRKHGIPWEWPDGLDAELAAPGFDESGIQPDSSRVDLRELPLVTIDGADARDFDDAVAASREDGGWTLWVAIADVSHYVKPGGMLDRVALERGNSVYFPGRVIPMLPEVLSNGLCSLKPEVDRYSLACRMRIAADGEVTGYEFHQALIRSRARLTYEAAQGYLDDPGSAAGKLDDETRKSLQALSEVHGALHRRRRQAGSLELEIAEPLFRFGPDRKIESVSTRSRLDSHRLIEECMLAANICAAKFIAGGPPGAMFRIHDRPDEDRLGDLRRVFGGFGVRFEGGAEPDAATLMKAVENARESRADVADTLQMLVLRAMRQAVYAIEPGLHFALGFEHYTHFTSPIRRYPDLVVHRLVKHRLRIPGYGRGPDAEALARVADHCSQTERRTEEATRDVYQWLKAEYMQDHVGEEFDGRITAVTQFGVFVTLDAIFIDGLVHISELGRDYFHFDPLRLELSGERSGKIYRLGDPLRIRVAGVDLDEAKIDFLPAEGAGVKRKSGKWSRT